MERLKFVSYDGTYPNLCRGKLIMELDGETISFPSNCLVSGGSVWFDDEWNEHVEECKWNINKFPPSFPKGLKSVAVDIFNTNVELGCCGGCI